MLLSAIRRHSHSIDGHCMSKSRSSVLMGYRRGSYALGYIDDTRDPIKILLPDYEGRKNDGGYDASRDRGLA